VQPYCVAVHPTLPLVSISNGTHVMVLQLPRLTLSGMMDDMLNQNSTFFGDRSSPSAAMAAAISLALSVRQYDLSSDAIRMMRVGLKSLVSSEVQNLRKDNMYWVHSILRTLKLRLEQHRLGIVPKTSSPHLSSRNSSARKRKGSQLDCEDLPSLKKELSLVRETTNDSLGAIWSTAEETKRSYVPTPGSRQLDEIELVLESAAEKTPLFRLSLESQAITAILDQLLVEQAFPEALNAIAFLCSNAGSAGVFSRREQLYWWQRLAAATRRFMASSPELEAEKHSQMKAVCACACVRYARAMEPTPAYFGDTSIVERRQNSLEKLRQSFAASISTASGAGHTSNSEKVESSLKLLAASKVVWTSMPAVLRSQSNVKSPKGHTKTDLSESSSFRGLKRSVSCPATIPFLSDADKLPSERTSRIRSKLLTNLAITSPSSSPASPAKVASKAPARRYSDSQQMLTPSSMPTLLSMQTWKSVELDSSHELFPGSPKD